jgi:ribosomal protein S18 acetylase RimI-like enzyme
MINIREANITDTEKIVNFQIAMAKETEDIDLDKQTIENGVRNVFLDHSKGKYFVAQENDDVIGSLMITFEWSDWRNGNVWWIQSVYIKPAHRGKKIFRLMYDHLKEQVLRNPEIRGLRLYVDKTNIHAQKVYEKVGMDGEHYQMFEWMK